jgi:phosphatidylglycerophosphatase A
VRKWIVTFGGAGLLPFMPGTFGSLAAAVLMGAVYFGLAPSFVVWQMILGVGMIVFSGLCVAYGPFAVEHFKRKDPGPMVLDEAAGICLTLLFQPIGGGWTAVKTLGAAFIAFRVFDIVKPPPARQLERLPMGWGILLDDLAAAVYANVVCQVVLRMWLMKGV